MDICPSQEDRQKWTSKRTVSQSSYNKSQWNKYRFLEAQSYRVKLKVILNKMVRIVFQLLLHIDKIFLVYWVGSECGWEIIHISFYMQNNVSLYKYLRFCMLQFQSRVLSENSNSKCLGGPSGKNSTDFLSFFFSHFYQFSENFIK